MKNVFALLALCAVAAVAVAGCTDVLTDPSSAAIVGTWKASKVGVAFGGSGTFDATFNTDNTFSLAFGGTTWSGTYSTSGSSASSSLRDISMSVTSPVSTTFVGIYEINGNQMKLEVVSSPPPSGVVGPNDVSGIGSTTINGSATTAYVSEMQKQ